MCWITILVSLACVFVSASAYEQQHVFAPISFSWRTVRLRQIQHHGSHRYPYLHRVVHVNNVTTFDGGPYGGTFEIRTSGPHLEQLQNHHTPNVTDKQTVLSFARMSANAYYSGTNDTGWKWREIGEGFNSTLDFGWEEDGLRGHVFVDEGNGTVVVALKGTSVPWLDDPATTERDLLNDNLFGSCCCGQGGPFFWQPVCDCQVEHGVCNDTCLRHELRNSSNYYSAARKIYDDVKHQYPHASIWLTGHSLGGVVASMLGHAYSSPTLTFEAYPDALASSRLGLSTPPGHKIGDSSMSASFVYHFGNTGDPIFMASCSSALSPCSLWGYAFESQCHTGRKCVYDTVRELGWRVQVSNHGIEKVIDEVVDSWDGVPECEEVRDCRDCEEWKFVGGR